MSIEPTVCAICLTRDRPELAKKAVQCFRDQTYRRKHLKVLDTGATWTQFDLGSNECYDARHSFTSHGSAATIGALRNLAIENQNVDILIHWDDDDYSHPNRIAEQVALLQASGADVVGYNEMLFWRGANLSYKPRFPGDRCEAWLYKATKGCTPILGTSMCYRRSWWEKNPFANGPSKGAAGVASEYSAIVKAADAAGKLSAVSSLVLEGEPAMPIVGRAQPRMIARIHSGNASRQVYNLDERVARGSNEWKRVPEWDARVRNILA